MNRRAWFPAAALLAGASLLLSSAAGQASPTKFKQGGTLRVVLPIVDVDDIDPSFGYGQVIWHIEQATALKLVNYPDAPTPRGSRLVLEGASSYKVSNGGRTYTFTIRKGFRFSNGARVTARNYAYAINRSLNRELQSPAFSFVADANAVEIAGAQAVREGKALRARGVRVRGNKLVIQLTRPDGRLLSILAMPFFQAIPLTLSSQAKVTVVDAAHPLRSAGPYYVSERTPNQSIELRRNPYYRGARPRRLGRLEIAIARSLDAAYQDVRSGRADYTYTLPSGALAELGKEYGLQGRFRVRPASCMNYIVMNTSAALFRNNPQLRQAVNYALDRSAMVGLGGQYTRVATDQYLPRGFPGFRDVQAYPFEPDVTKAQALAQGHVPSGGPWKYVYGLEGVGPQRMELVRAQLRKIGIEIEPQGFRGFNIYDAIAKGAFDFGAFAFCPGYADPADVIKGLLRVARFDDPVYNGRLERAERLTGAARLNAFANLDRDLVTGPAPLAAWSQSMNQFFFSDRVNMGSFAYQPVYESPPYNLLALK